MNLRTLLLLLLCGHVPNAFGESVITVVHPSVTLPSITRNFARALFGMRVAQWPGDGDVTVFVLPDQHNLHAAFAKNILDVFPQQLRNAWDRQVFSGTGQAPIEVSSETEMQDRVATTPGAIGYLPKDKIDVQKVRILEIVN